MANSGTSTNSTANANAVATAAATNGNDKNSSSKNVSLQNKQSSGNEMAAGMTSPLLKDSDTSTEVATGLSESETARLLQESNSKKYQSTEGDSLWKTVSKAYIRSLPLILKKKCDSGTTDCKN
jgi:hypothetical protein